MFTVFCPHPLENFALPGKKFTDVHVHSIVFSVPSDKVLLAYEEKGVYEGYRIRFKAKVRNKVITMKKWPTKYTN